MILCTVAVKGREGEGAFLVYQMTDTHAIVALPEDAQLIAVPLSDCRVMSRYLDPGAALWWGNLLEAGRREQADMAAHMAENGPQPVG